VTGTVKYNGKVLAKPDGEVIFVGPGGIQKVGSIAQDGTYKVSGVPGGKNRVAVYYKNPAAANWKPAPRPKGVPKEAPPPRPPSYLTPDIYANPDTSEFEVEVKQGVVFDIEMKGPDIP
jgi:hypothetical protein